MCCIVLQSVAVCCSALQCVAVCRHPPETRYEEKFSALSFAVILYGKCSSKLTLKIFGALSLGMPVISPRYLYMHVHKKFCSHDDFCHVLSCLTYMLHIHVLIMFVNINISYTCSYNV